MTDPIEIETQRLLLKGISPALIHTLFEEKSKDEISMFFAVDGDGYHHLTAMHEQGMETHRISLFYFLLLDKQSNRVIGECGFHTWNKTHQRAELFYSLRNDSDKRIGFMTEALSAVLDFGFEQLGLHRIEGLTANWNTASVKLLTRYGFTKEGTMREDYIVNGRHEDSDCYSLLKQEWKSRQVKY